MRRRWISFVSSLEDEIMQLQEERNESRKAEWIKVTIECISCARQLSEGWRRWWWCRWEMSVFSANTSNYPCCCWIQYITRSVLRPNTSWQPQWEQQQQRESTLTESGQASIPVTYEICGAVLLNWMSCSDPSRLKICRIIIQWKIIHDLIRMKNEKHWNWGDYTHFLPFPKQQNIWLRIPEKLCWFCLPHSNRGARHVFAADRAQPSSA